MAAPADNNILALDVGDARVGVAIAHSIARLPRPLTTLDNSETIFDALRQLIASENVDRIVVGLPRNLSGDATAQTGVAEAFAKRLADQTGLSVAMQDEALTSVKAEKELRARGAAYTKGDIDALAATYILEDYLQAHEGAISHE
jgi:putative Holliday junction resolvase